MSLSSIRFFSPTPLPALHKDLKAEDALIEYTSPFFPRPLSPQSLGQVTNPTIFKENSVVRYGFEPCPHDQLTGDFASVTKPLSAVQFLHLGKWG